MLLKSGMPPRRHIGLKRAAKAVIARQTKGLPAMRLTKFSDYALRALMLAASRPDERVTVNEAAQLYGISHMHLKKVVKFLSAEGYLDATRGHHGGFALALPPAAINLGVLIRKTEPDFGLVECFLDGNSCPISHCCGLAGIFNDGLAAFLMVLDNYTLADFMLPRDRFDARGTPPFPLRGPHLPPARDAR